ncbi:MAG: trypsin-like peptidase domain-containing protein, partial [Candidatus Bipolaricaulaceae bacterium]
MRKFLFSSAGWFLFLVGSASLAQAQATDWPSLIQAAKPAVVWILAETAKGTSAGSGALVSPDGYILTAAHVIEGATRVKVVVEDSREYWASVVNTDARADVAVLKISASGLKWFALGDSDQVRIEEEIRVLGYPIPEVGAGMIAVAGVIQGTRVRDGVKLLQHNAATAGGHSGGPVINAQGQVIGIHSARLREDPGYRFAVGVNEAKRLIPWGALPTGPSPIRPATGPTAVTGPIRVPGDQPTLAAALRAAPEGGEVQLARGTHRGDAYVTKSVTITGEAGAVVEGTIRVSAARAATITNLEVRGGIEIRDTTGFTLDRVTVRGAPGDGIAVEASTGVITGCTVEEAKGSGIAATFGARVTITNTAVRRCGKSGISLTLNSQARITGCTIERNGEDGIYLAGSTAEVRGSTIRENAGWGIAGGGGVSLTPTDFLSANTFAGNGKGEAMGIGPARFIVRDLQVSPEPPVPMNTRVTVSATVTNVGEAGTKGVWLSLGGTKAQETKLSLNPGQSRRVEFTYSAAGEIVTICSEDACSAEVAVHVHVDRAAFAHRIPLPEGAVRRQGIGYITDHVAFSSDGKLAVTTSLGIELWDVATMELVRFFEHRAWSVAFSPDGRTLASGSEDGTIKLWDVATGKDLRTLAGHRHAVTSVAFSPDGRTVASASRLWNDNTIKLWDVATGKELRTLAGHTDAVSSVAFSPDGRTLASGWEDGTIKLWDVATGKELRTLAGHTSGVNSVAFSPDGRTLASGSYDRI